MAQVPNNMPAMPAAQAPGGAVFEAEDARRGCTPEAAGNSPANIDQQVLQALQAQGAALQELQLQLAQQGARLDNVRRRYHNAKIPHWAHGAEAALRVLVKENVPLEGAAPAGAAPVGTLPPQGIFPATWPHVWRLDDTALDTLALFYGEQFGANNAGVRERVAAFTAFIMM